MKRRIPVVFCTVALSLGAGVFAKALLTNKGSQTAFTLRSRVININGDGTQSTLEKVRYVSSSGDWRVVLTNPDGKHAEYFFRNGLGFFKVDFAEKVLRRDPRGSDSAPVPMTPEQLRAHPQFVGTEQVLGLTAYIIRVKDEQTGAPESDAYQAPELGNVPIKSVVYAEGRPVVIDEPIAIAFGEPESASLKGPNYAVR
jgi:hypothetical protein